MQTLGGGADILIDDVALDKRGRGERLRQIVSR
jgi:hypothetical protein